MSNNVPLILTIILPSLSLLLLAKSTGIRLIGGIAWGAGFFIALPFAPIYLIGSLVVAPLLFGMRAIVAKLKATNPIFHSGYVPDGITRILIILAATAGIVGTINVMVESPERPLTTFLISISVIPWSVFALGYGSIWIAIGLYRWIRSGF